MEEINQCEGQKRTSFQSGNTRTFQLYTNTPLEIKSLGFVLVCLEKYKDFEVSVNYNYAEFNFDQSKILVSKLI
jgi:hypothetical protein